MGPVPVVLLAGFAPRLSEGSGCATANPFCIQPEVTAGCHLYTGVRTGDWYGPETWLSAGSLSEFY